MSEGMKRDMARLQELIGDAFTKTGSLVALTDGGVMSPEKLQKTLEQTADQFEMATLELRRLCEQAAPGAGGYAKRPVLNPVRVTGSVETFGLDSGWLHIKLNTLLPHCRYQTPGWLTDTIRRLLDDYEAAGNTLPRFERALLVIDEHSDVSGRHIFDSDNKGWKAVSNAIKGRLIPVHAERGPAVQKERRKRLPHLAARPAGSLGFLCRTLRLLCRERHLRRPLALTDFCK